MSLVEEARRGNAAQVAALLRTAVADANAADVKGCTPLYHAVDKGTWTRVSAPAPARAAPRVRFASLRT